METAQQTEKERKFKQRKKIGAALFLGIIVVGTVWCGVAIGTQDSRPEPGSLPCREDWTPAQVSAEVEGDPYQYLGQCFEFSGPASITDDGIFIDSVEGHLYSVLEPLTCVAGDVVEGGNVSARAYLLAFPQSIGDGNFTMFFSCIPEVNPNL